MKTTTILFATIVAVCMSRSLFAQTIEIVKRGKSTTHERVTNFEYLEPSTILKCASFVATLKAIGTGKDKSIPNLFFALNYKTYQLQANSFKVIAFVKEKVASKIELTIDIYYCSDSILLINKNNHVKNTVFIFTDDKESDDTFSFSINDVEREVKSGRYLRYSIPKSGSAEISQGKLFKNTSNIAWKENKPSQFRSLTKFGLAPTKESPEYLSRFFNMGTLNIIDNDLGYLLASLLKREE